MTTLWKIAAGNHMYQLQNPDRVPDAFATMLREIESGIAWANEDGATDEAEGLLAKRARMLERMKSEYPSADLRMRRRLFAHAIAYQCLCNVGIDVLHQQGWNASSLDHPALNEFLHACSARLVRDDFFDDAKVLWYSMVPHGAAHLMPSVHACICQAREILRHVLENMCEQGLDEEELAL
jgi:hypothetical protein